MAGHVPKASIIPVAIRYEMSTHQRPECFLLFGPPVPDGDHLGNRTRLAVKRLLDELAMKIKFHPGIFQTLAPGTPDAGELPKSR